MAAGYRILGKKMKRHLMQCMFGLALAASLASAQAEERFTILRFQVDGNSLLSATELQNLLAPFVGEQRSYGDVQQALEALEAAYRKLGYSAVNVNVPEQELTAGVVQIKVSEVRFGKITVTGNKYFSEANIRASLPPVQSGQVPNLRKISEAVQLSNDNPAKQLNVTLTATATEDNVTDAELRVTDYDPLRVILTLDNTGAKSTGKWRSGVALQEANLFGRDHVGTLAYSTSPDSPGGVSVNVYSLGYRIPFYSIGDSLDLIYGKSSVNTPSSSEALGQLIGFTGKGDVYGLHWNHFFARQGESTSKLVAGVDYKKIGSHCDYLGSDLILGSCVPYTLMPLSVTYSGQKQSTSQNTDYSIGIVRNIGTGARYTTDAGRTDYYSYVTGRDTRDDFVVLRGAASIFRVLPKGWQMRVAGTAQYAVDPLVSAEQLGLVGASAVRGFGERAVAADSGAFINTELYTPELVSQGNLRLLAFYDLGRGYNNHIGGSGLAANMTVSSLGLGARYALGRDFSVKLDIARVGATGNSLTEKRGDVSAHVNATLGF
jgi:hemolysin activation/secretion protein